ncbi:hypothetical protein M405DRAFT_908158 [Rhizopogon salebrosus TDB-379]|nr:hypothetical protein M405DRAFT_908158 [Rhizopogon salebrosus TDB-379]
MTTHPFITIHPSEDLRIEDERIDALAKESSVHYAKGKYVNVTKTAQQGLLWQRQTLVRKYGDANSKGPMSGPGLVPLSTEDAPHVKVPPCGFAEILAYTLDGLRLDCPLALTLSPTSESAPPANSFLALGFFQRHLTAHHLRAVAPSATSAREPSKLGVTGCYKPRLSKLSTSTSTTTGVMSHATSLSLLSYSPTVIMSDYSTFTTALLQPSNTVESPTTIVSHARIIVTSGNIIVTGLIPQSPPPLYPGPTPQTPHAILVTLSAA